MEAKQHSDDRYIPVEDLASHWISMHDATPAPKPKSEKTRPSNANPPSPPNEHRDAQSSSTRRVASASTGVHVGDVRREVIVTTGSCTTLLLMIVSAVVASLVTVIAAPQIARLVCD